MKREMIVSNGYRKYGFDAFGGSVLRKRDMAHWMNSPKRTDPRGVALELGEDVLEVERGFFELLPTVDELWMRNPNCRVRMTDETEKLFRNNNVLIRGVYDTSAEAFAEKYRLRFLHLDTELASVGDYYDRGNDLITLRLRDDGGAYIHQDCRCQGISAGNTGGGEVSFDLPKDFYLSMTARDVADMCWGSCRSEIVSRGILGALMEKAKQKNGFLLDFSRA